MIGRSALVLTVSSLAVLLGAVVVGCSRGDGAGGDASAGGASGNDSRPSSCDRVAAMSVCSEYSGPYLAQNEAILRSSCGKLGGTFSAGACPNTSVLGSCMLPTSEVRKFHASGGALYDAATAEKECTSSYRGKWESLR